MTKILREFFNSDQCFTATAPALDSIPVCCAPCPVAAWTLHGLLAALVPATPTGAAAAGGFAWFVSMLVSPPASCSVAASCILHAWIRLAACGCVCFVSRQHQATLAQAVAVVLVARPGGCQATKPSCIRLCSRALLPVCAAAVLRLLRDAPAPHPATFGLNWDFSLRCDTLLQLQKLPWPPKPSRGWRCGWCSSRHRHSCVWHRHSCAEQLSQMVQLLVNDRLRPRSSSTSNLQRDRCGCTRSAQFLSQGPQLDVMQVTQCCLVCIGVQWHFMRENVVQQAGAPNFNNGCPPAECCFCAPLAAVTAVRMPSLTTTPSRATHQQSCAACCWSEELDAAEVVTAHIYQLHWGPEFAVSRHWQQARELLSVCTVCGV